MEKVRNAFFKIANIRIYGGFILVGLIMAAAAIFFITSTKDFVPVNATVENIESYEDSDNETQYDVTLTYVVDGEEYTTVGNYYSSGMKEGDIIEIQYNPNDPTSTASSGSGVVLYIMAVAGIGAFIFGLFKLISALKAKNGGSQMNRVDLDHVDPSIKAQIQNSTEESKEYYFHFTGKLDQDYVMETPERVAVYEAKCDKFTLLTDFEYTFTNKVALRQEKFKVSHTLTTEVGSGNISMVTSSSFKVNGRNCWDHLADLGYSIEPRLEGLTYKFTVSRYGVPVAEMAQAGRNIVLDADKQTKMGDVLTTPGYYKVCCRQSDLDGIFFACFCLGRIQH